ncbi:MAG TPA: ATP-grasp domain-containing protein [Oligoflexia bacterium]|nr:ATP-grasp domain-containing protein [Oligoflexia bacterium]HMR24292.1 ATP-grasp domain-containing protein [Oligoflexia bacterium]
MLKVGFTFDLKDDYLKQGFSPEQAAEFDSLETILFLEQALKANNYQVEKIGGVKKLVNALAKGKRWDIVFNICEGVKGFGRESQVPALLEAYNIPFVFSSSDVMMITMNKSIAKLLVEQHGLKTPKFAVINNPNDIQNVNLPFPLFVKPLGEGTGKGIHDKSLVHNQVDLENACMSILNEFHHPALVETYLSGRDFTVGVLGSGKEAYALGVMEVKQKSGKKLISQCYYNKENCENVLDYSLATDDIAKNVAQLAVQCWQVLGCHDAGRVDIRCDDQGTPYFLEVNPMAGLHPTHSDLPILAHLSGMNHVELIGKIMKYALARHNLDAKGLKIISHQQQLA